MKKEIKKNKKTNKENNRTNNFKKDHKLLIVFISIILVIFVIGILFISYIIMNAPEFSANSIYNKEQSIIYDAKGNEIAKLGTQKRELITYDELPQVLIDAIIATEDSRFFQHNGFDIARFAKATLGQVTGNSGAGGGSTLTMQLSKNHVTDTTATGIKGIIRKFTDIYLAVFKIEKNFTKEEIIEFYVNTPWMSNGAYGVEQASKNYFGKSVKDLTLTEAAIIAGMFQAPESYNPFNNPELTTKRRSQVLGLMVKHGYITTEEKEYAEKIPVESLLTNNNAYTNKYQAFIDTVVEEVIKKEGINPYSTPVLIYSTLDTERQDAINGVMNGETWEFVDDQVQMGIAVTSVENGSIVAVGAGRNRIGERQYNYATMISRQPGSTAKPFFVYGPGIEYLNWSTYTPFFDEEYTYSNGSKIKNADGKYNGFMTLETALGKSRNIPALQGFQQLEKDQITDFVHSLGINYGENLYESAATGGFNGMSPLTMSSAFATFARGGYYIEPYSYTKLVYRESEKVVETVVSKKQVMSAESAYMMNYVLKYATTQISSSLKVSGTDIAAKTGTTTISNSAIKQYELPSSAINDSWISVYSPDYSYSIWYGYRYLSNKYFLKMTEASAVRRKVAILLKNDLLETNSKFTKPKGLIEVEVELETVPGSLASPFTPEELKTVAVYKEGTEPTDTSTRFSLLNNPTNGTGTYDNNTITITWNKIPTPDAINTVYLQNYFNTYFTLWAEKYYNARIEYNKTYIGTNGYEIYLKNSNNTLTRLGFTTNNTFTFNGAYNESYTFVVKSAYSIFKDNMSSGIEINVKTNNLELSLNGNNIIYEDISDGFYIDQTNPVNVVYNNTSIASFNLATTIKRLSDNTIVTNIPLNVADTYQITYQVSYLNKIKTITRKVIVS